MKIIKDVAGRSTSLAKQDLRRQILRWGGRLSGSSETSSTRLVYINSWQSWLDTITWGIGLPLKLVAETTSVWLLKTDTWPTSTPCWTTSYYTGASFGSSHPSRHRVNKETSPFVNGLYQGHHIFQSFWISAAIILHTKHTLRRFPSSQKRLIWVSTLAENRHSAAVKSVGTSPLHTYRTEYGTNSFKATAFLAE